MLNLGVSAPHNIIRLRSPRRIILPVFPGTTLFTSLRRGGRVLCACCNHSGLVCKLSVSSSSLSGSPLSSARCGLLLHVVSFYRVDQRRASPGWRVHVETWLHFSAAVDMSVSDAHGESVATRESETGREVCSGWGLDLDLGGEMRSVDQLIHLCKQ